MTTIGKLPPNAAVAAYRDALARIGQPQPPGGGAGQAAAGSSFGGLLRDELRGAVADQRRAEQTTMAGLSGQASLQQVVEAVSRAELSLQTVTAVRDRVIAAYQEILRMPI